MESQWYKNPWLLIVFWVLGKPPAREYLGTVSIFIHIFIINKLAELRHGLFHVKTHNNSFDRSILKVGGPFVNIQMTVVIASQTIRNFPKFVWGLERTGGREWRAAFKLLLEIIYTWAESKYISVCSRWCIYLFIYIVPCGFHWPFCVARVGLSIMVAEVEVALD